MTTSAVKISLLLIVICVLFDVIRPNQAYAVGYGGRGGIKQDEVGKLSKT